MSTNYTPDLELRRKVAECANPNWQIVAEIMSEYERSFDAILPLVRELWKKVEIEPHLQKIWRQLGKPCGCFQDWILLEITPADYCRAYLAAMESQTPAQQEK